MRIITTIDQTNLKKSVEATKIASEKGFNGIVTLENKHDPFLPLAAATTTNNELDFYTGIALAFVRSPMSTAHMSWDLNVATNGRFRLGIGPQIRAHNERRYSVKWSAPAPRIKEYVKALRAIWECWDNGTELNFRGDFYQFTLMPPNFTPEKVNCRVPRITIAAVGPKMMRLAAKVADGVQLHPFCTEKYLNEFILPTINDELSKNGKSRKKFEIIGGCFIATGSTVEEVQKSREWVRKRIGFYASTPAYWPVLESEGHKDLGLELNKLTKLGKWDKLEELIPDSLVNSCCISGTNKEIVERISTRLENKIDTLVASQSYEKPSLLNATEVSEIKKIQVVYSDDPIK